MACKYKSKVWDNGWCNVACMYCTLTQESTCKNNKQTNADRIRAMSNEELANVIALIIEKDECFREDFADCEKCPLHSFCSECKPGIELEWLKQPAE